MTILLADDAVTARRRAVAGGLAPLAASLAADLAPVVARQVWLPPEKARLTRRGGWCPRDGTRLDFDPFAPHAHRCPRCGDVFDGDDHYRWWIVGYQLWLAERAVHGAALALVAGRADLGAFADRVLDACATAYLGYPNADNVLGPTRPFFSTYLESIWLLQLCVALSLRERAGAAPSLGARVRERVVEPSARLIAAYDEGASNRQVWNNAALLAAGALLGTGMYERAFDGSSGVVAHMTGGLLADGSWYEGENYHLFAHRGLWYGAELAAARGGVLPAEARRRLDAGFVTPFLTALPDFTFPARRDSAYGISLRQWRFAELAELGVARAADAAPPELLGALRTLYDPAIPRIATERARSTAETERNAPASGLARADLGWRALLFALETLPESGASASGAGSVLLAEQGIAVLRRDGGAIYAALDYGRSGGGHGHPDRLNLLLSDGAARWQDDVGTGSYTEPTLHWYRSTLAHGAPLVDGCSQRRVDGLLLAFDERGDVGLVRACAAIDDGVLAERTLVVCADYVITELRWTANGTARIVDLPIHVEGQAGLPKPWSPIDLGGSAVAEDGFAFLTSVEGVELAASATWTLRSRRGERALDLWTVCDARSLVWRADAPSPPGEPAPRRMHAVRAAGEQGRIVQLWSLRGAVADVHVDGATIIVSRADGTVHRHAIDRERWRVEQATAERATAEDETVDDATGGDATFVAVATLDRGGGPPRLQRESPAAPDHHPASAARTDLPPLGDRPLAFELGERSYRRSEPTWRDAGAPTAHVALTASPTRLRVDVHVRKRDPIHAPDVPPDNPLDNELADTNADGVQLHLALPDGRGGEHALGWLAVPAGPGGAARLTPLGDPDARADVIWAPAPDGYVMRFDVPLPADARALALDVVINETSPARERRRGQLVLSGGDGEFVYLRGARQSRDRFLTFSLPHV